MLVERANLGENTKVWIYQAERVLDEKESKGLIDFIKKSIEGWEAHGAPLKASFEFFKNQFLVILADEGYNTASGCSIDASTRWLKQWGEFNQVNFFDRKIYIEKPNGEMVGFGMTDLKSAIESGKIREEDLVFTPNVPNYASFVNNWPEKVGESWMKRYFNLVN